MKTAVVSGTSYGIGESIAIMLLGINFKVYGISRTKSSINNKNFIWIKADLLNLKESNKIRSLIKESKIDILINNAGTHIEELALSISLDRFNHIFGLNFLAPAFLTKTLSSKLTNGLVINISSTSDRFAEERAGLYCASKAAMDIFFETLGVENKNIKVINLLPSYVDTPLQHKISDKKDFDWEQCITPDQVAGLVRDLIEDNFNVSSGSKVMVVNSKTMSDTKEPEKLYFYNVDTKEFKKLK